METNHETSPIPADDPPDTFNNNYLPAYREYWDGRRWVVGEYQDLTGGPEVDYFIEENRDAKP